jgi:hypothetical protein
VACGIHAWDDSGSAAKTVPVAKTSLVLMLRLCLVGRMVAFMHGMIQDLSSSLRMKRCDFHEYSTSMLNHPVGKNRADARRSGRTELIVHPPPSVFFFFLVTYSCRPASWRRCRPHLSWHGCRKLHPRCMLLGHINPRLLVVETARSPCPLLDCRPSTAGGQQQYDEYDRVLFLASLDAT